MTVRRRELLATLGIASSSTLLWALGCGAPSPPLRRTPQIGGELRTWLQDAVARLGAVHPIVHALAVSRRRTTVARDVLGRGVARLGAAGILLAVRSRDGTWREHVTSDLTKAGVDAAATALGATRQRKRVEFGPAPVPPVEPLPLEDRDLSRRVDLLFGADAAIARRIVYAAALIELDDTLLWSIAPGRDLAQRLVRIRQTVTRAAWSGTHPVVRDVHRAWSGGLDDQTLTAGEITAASEAALEQMTPGAFDEAPRPLVLDPSVVAIVLDTAVRGLLTSAAARRPEVAHRLTRAPHLAGPLITLIDDPTTPGAYGGFAFDDEGEPAAPITVLDAGRVAARLSDHAGGGAGRGRRAGHLARVEPSPSHLRLVPGATPTSQLHADGLVLEGGLHASLDPATDRLRVACARARELRAGNPTGRVYPDVELVGTLTDLLTAVDAVGRDPIDIAVPGPGRAARDPDRDRDRDPDPHPRWTSVAAPALRTRGFVRARRSRT